ncbi:hypothetical protein QBC37DRAFT_401676 [Rhypophila decipiens]|uniref:Uncharacterized protein n=1 Tax=Rhypophila decipiens TaxID=261697 RepID=A0AAN6Y6R3_9PEZI|nr:hypothetical protein QBC37DRAFT_401676 [Rhypophila decipiens]
MSQRPFRDVVVCAPIPVPVRVQVSTLTVRQLRDELEQLARPESSFLGNVHARFKSQTDLVARDKAVLNFSSLPSMVRVSRDGGGNLAGSNEALESRYWDDNMAQSVLFSQAVEHAMMGVLPPPLDADRQMSLQHEPFDAMVIEVGPHPALRSPVLDNIRSVPADVAEGNDDIFVEEAPRRQRVSLIPFLEAGATTKKAARMTSGLGIVSAM